MTFYSRLWRYKRIKKIRVINKIHNSFLRGITGMMLCIFLLALCSFDNLNGYVVAGYIISFMWLALITIANSEVKDND